MRNLDDVFMSLNVLEPTDLRTDVEQRAGQQPPESPQTPYRDRVLAAVVAIGVTLAAGAFVWSRFHHTTQPAAPLSVWTPYPNGLSRLPDPPPLGPSSDVTVWTGDSLIIWGGGEPGGDPPYTTDGSIFDATSGSWQSLPAAPLEPRTGSVGVWTGAEVVVWGGVSGYGEGARSFRDGAALDPATGSWRPVAANPWFDGTAIGAVWDQSAMIVIGSRSVAAYDPNEDAWTELPALPSALEEGEVAWTGSEVVVVGNIGTSRNWSPAAWAYAPGSDEWRRLGVNLDDVPSIDVMWDGRRIISAGGMREVAAFDEASGEWRTLPDVPTNDCEGGGYHSASAIGGLVASNYCQELVTIGPNSDRWHVVVGRGTEPDPLGYWYRAPVPVGGAFLLWGGSRNSPTAWLYRPSPAVSGIDAAHDVAAAFGALRSDYPYTATSVPDDIDLQMRRLVTPEARSTWEDSASELRAFWDYYPGFEVRSVENNGDGTFDATIWFAGYNGGEFKEVVTIGPGVDMDGVARDLVIVDARPG